MILPNLGDVYCIAYSHRLSGLSSISRAIKHYSTALSMSRPEGLARLQYKIGKAYATMFIHTSNDEDLRLGHSYLEPCVVSDLPVEDKEDAALKLSAMYEHKYDEMLTRDTLDSAIYWARRAVHIQDENSDPRILRKVASLLTLLYKDFGDISALDSAITSYENVWDYSGTHETEDSATFYFNYGTALMRRSSAGYTSHQRVLADLKRAIELLQQAVDNADSDDLLAYEFQLNTALERFNKASARTSEQGGSMPFLNPTRSATLPNRVDLHTTRTDNVADDQPKPVKPLRSGTLQEPINDSNPSSSFPASTKRYVPGISSRQRTLPTYLSPTHNAEETYLSPIATRSASSDMAGSNSRMPPSLSPQLQKAYSLPALPSKTPESRLHQSSPPPKGSKANSPDYASPQSISSPPLSALPSKVIEEEHDIISAVASEENGTDVASSADGSSSIKPTNLTGRIKDTDRFPVDEGGFSSIYKGSFGSTKVAIKVIRNLTALDSVTMHKRLRREMDVWWKLDHPNVVPLWGYTDDMGPLPSMISPWYENGNASSYVQKQRLSIEFKLQLLREVSAGLRYLHHFSPPIVHGDLKPGNVLIDNDGIARLCDFGLAHLVSDVDATITATSNVGTIRYAAPELRCPEDDDEVVRASTQTDIYSLACIAYEFLYEKQPFADRGSIQTIIAAGYSHIPPARMETEDLSVLGPIAPHYWELFQSCWDERADNRPDITSFCEHIDLAFFAFSD
ncbi:hypothetical protein M408DRAFT_121808 [Serendipita vermifera MAFF 305830]|uniref:Protein kinase domain-containing protein n=1 Tax=Serendipita vermifera MAFF 305830 TaxID=933852 RepID=A0A0C3BAY7_SERVB|nr:hypothetical protein M408DRAFT_121808 [Serendipita vermifera MAFF 305830]